MRGIETATASIHRKKSMVMQKRASSLISQASYTLNDTALDVSGHPIASRGGGVRAEDGAAGAGAGAVVKAKSASQKYMEKVKYLQTEMERARSGVKLLDRSVQRLNEAVLFDSRCCGGLSDALSFVMGSCFEHLRPAVTNEYSSVQMQALDDSGHDSQDSQDSNNSDDDGDVHELHSSSNSTA